MNVELYILLKIKGQYNHSRKERWIYNKLEEPDIEIYKSVLYGCRDKNLIRVVGARNIDSSLYYRDLELTPYGEQRLNQLKAEYMKRWRKSILSVVKVVLEVIVAIITILSLLLKWMK